MSSSGLIRTVSFQPSSRRLRRDDDVVPGDPVQHLHVVQVEVDRVRVDAVVGDLPDLGPVGRRRDRLDVDVALGQVGAVDDLGRRVRRTGRG